MRAEAEAEFEAFVVAVMPQLERLGCALAGGDIHQGKDLVQSTFEKLYTVWGRRALNSPTAYARTTLVKTFLSQRRRASHLREVIEADPGRQESGQQEIVDDLPARLTMLDLDRALRQLPPRQRAAVVLRYLEDLSIAEVAVAMKSSQGNVKRLTHDGLERLRELVPSPLGVESP
jgi:RNA polymerase sigma factor (sigma-70 family)